MSTIPNPGSEEARKQGCLCPIVDNEFGKGYLGDGERFGFVSNEHCPLHGANSTGSTKPWNFIEQFKTMEYLRPSSDSVVECPVCHSQEFYEGETEYKLRCSDCSFIMEFEYPPTPNEEN